MRLRRVANATTDHLTRTPTPRDVYTVVATENNPGGTASFFIGIPHRSRRAASAARPALRYSFGAILERRGWRRTVVPMSHNPTKWYAVLARHWAALVVPFLVPGAGILTGIVLSRLINDTSGGWGDLIGMAVGLALGSMIALATLSAIAARTRGKLRATGYGLGGAGMAWFGLVFAARNSMSAGAVLLVLAICCGYVVFAGRGR